MTKAFFAVNGDGILKTKLNVHIILNSKYLVNGTKTTTNTKNSTETNNEINNGTTTSNDNNGKITVFVKNKLVELFTASCSDKTVLSFGSKLS